MQALKPGLYCCAMRWLGAALTDNEWLEMEPQAARIGQGGLQTFFSPALKRLPLAT